MQVTTRQGAVLTVHLAAIDRIPGGQPGPIVDFRYQGGILCGSRWLADFMAHPTGEDLYLEWGVGTTQQLSPESVAACQAQCAAWMAEVQA